MNGTRGMKLGRVLGIDIAFDYSWLFIVILMTWSLAVSFGRWHPDWSTALSLFTALSAALLFFASVLLHELAHSFWRAASASPFTSSCSFSSAVFRTSSASRRARRPSSYRRGGTAHEHPARRRPAGRRVARHRGLPGRGHEFSALLGRLGPAQTLLMWLGPINIVVGVFNLIPGFPLDGGRILRSILWGTTHDLHTATRWAAAVGQAIGWLFVFLGVAIAFGANVPFLGEASSRGCGSPHRVVSELRRGAELEATARSRGPRGARRGTLMRTPGSPVLPRSTSRRRHDWLMRSDERAFPVMDTDGELLGLVTMADIRAVPREAWPAMRVSQIMTPRERLVTAAPREDAAEALEKSCARTSASCRHRGALSHGNAPSERHCAVDRAAHADPRQGLRALRDRCPYRGGGASAAPPEIGIAEIPTRSSSGIREISFVDRDRASSLALRALRTA